jgi:hypothetical protein
VGRKPRKQIGAGEGVLARKAGRVLLRTVALRPDGSGGWACCESQRWVRAEAFEDESGANQRERERRHKHYRRRRILKRMLRKAGLVA